MFNPQALPRVAARGLLLDYHSLMRRLLAIALVAALPAAAQIRGVPPSVTSMGPGRSAPGVPASVTSLGPHGFGSSWCCGVNFSGGVFFGHHFHHHPFDHHPFHHHHFVPVFVPYYYPYYSSYPAPYTAPSTAEYEAEEEPPAPTIYERRRSEERRVGKECRL